MDWLDGGASVGCVSDLIVGIGVGVLVDDGTKVAVNIAVGGTDVSVA